MICLGDLDGVLADAQVRLQVRRLVSMGLHQFAGLAGVRLGLLLDLRQARQEFLLDILQANLVRLLPALQDDQVESDVVLDLRGVPAALLHLLPDRELHLLEQRGGVEQLEDILALGRHQQIVQVLAVDDLAIAVEVVQEHAGLGVDAGVDLHVALVNLLQAFVALGAGHGEGVLGGVRVAPAVRLEFVRLVGELRLLGLERADFVVGLQAGVGGHDLEGVAQQALAAAVEERLVLAAQHVLVFVGDLAEVQPSLAEGRALDILRELFVLRQAIWIDDGLGGRGGGGVGIHQRGEVLAAGGNQQRACQGEALLEKNVAAHCWLTI